MLQSPKFHVSRTRLIIYNLPKTMTTEEVKKLCVNAVVSRASKQKPVIQKVGFYFLLSFQVFGMLYYFINLNTV